MQIGVCAKEDGARQSGGRRGVSRHTGGGGPRISGSRRPCRPALSGARLRNGVNERPRRAGRSGARVFVLTALGYPPGIRSPPPSRRRAVSVARRPSPPRIDLPASAPAAKSAAATIAASAAPPVPEARPSPRRSSRARRYPRRPPVDPQHDKRAGDAQPARNHRRNRIRAEARAQHAGAERRERRAELVARDDPAEHDGRRILAVHVGGEAHGGRHGRDPVEPVEHREKRQPEEIDAERMRQIDQRQPAQPVVPEQQHAAVVAVGQPAGHRRADQVEHAHRREQRRALHLRHPVVAAHREQMRADVAVRARAADEEPEEQQPEVARLRCGREHAERARDRVALRAVLRARRVRGLAVRAPPDVRRPLRQQQRDERHRDRRRHRDRQHAGPPAVALRDRREHRQKHELARRGTRSQQPHHEAAPRDEPARDERRRQRERRDARRAADHHAPDEHHLPCRRHHRRQRDAHPHHAERGEHCRPHAETLHRRGRERPGQAIERDVHRNRERDRRAAPAELMLERHHQHARRRAGARRREKNQEHHRRREPTVMETPAYPPCRPVHSFCS